MTDGSLLTTTTDEGLLPSEGADHELLAAHRAAVLLDVGERVQIEVTGRDRHKFLHNFCTNDIKKLTPGQGCEAFVTNIKGKVIGHIFVFVETDSLWIESVAGSATALMAHLERFVITEDVRFSNRSDEFTELLLVGPRAAETLIRLGLPVSDLPKYGHVPADAVLSKLSLSSVRRVDWFQVPTWLLSLPRSERDSVTRLLTEASSGVTTVRAEVFDALRIAAAFPLFGIDITEEQLAREVGRTSSTISFTKGCYLGQEPIARIDAMGHVNRELRRLRLSSGPLPSLGIPLLDKPVPAGKPVGNITSSAWSLLSRNSDIPLALAYVRSGFNQPGTKLVVGDTEAVVL